MKSFKKIVKHKYFALIATLLILALPILLIVAQQNQETRSRADASTTLYFSPDSSKGAPITKNVGDEFYLDVMLNPGNDLVSLVKMDIKYDSSIMSPSKTNPVVVNNVIFPQILEGPVFTDGRIQIVLSVGPDLTKAMSSESRILTLNFLAKGETRRSEVNFGENISVSSVSLNDTANENVLLNFSPAYIRINGTKQGGNNNSGNIKDNPGQGKKPK